MSKPIIDQPTRQRSDSQCQTDSNYSWKKERRNSFEGKLTNVVETMVMNTSCLAIGNIFIRKHKCLKVLWCLAFIFCTILTIRQLYSLTNTYLKYPVSTYIELKTAQVIFPSVTICNLNPLRNSKISKYGSPQLRDFIENFRTKSYFTKDNGTEIDTHRRDWTKLKEYVSNHTMESRLRMGHQINDFILQCTFNGEKCDMDKLFMTEISDEYGNCYTLNGWKKFNRTGGKVTTKHGRDNGLIITLFLEYDEYLVNLVSTAGVRLHIHESNSLEEPDIHGFSIPPGFESLIGLREERIIRLNKPHGNCSSGEYFEKLYKMKYTRGSCKTVCRHNNIAKKCKCKDRVNSHLYLNSKLGNCTTKKEIDCLISNIDDDNSIEFCNCPLPCNELRYIIKQSLSQWPADTYQNRLFGDLSDINSKMFDLVNTSKTLARSNLLNLVIYQEDTYYNEILQKPTYAWDNYLSDVGGTLNLFLGFSLLTGFEVAEAFCILIAYISSKLIYCDSGCTENSEKEHLTPSDIMPGLGTRRKSYTELDSDSETPVQRKE